MNDGFIPFQGRCSWHAFGLCIYMKPLR